jgi:hypothetical protein
MLVRAESGELSAALVSPPRSLRPVYQTTLPQQQPVSTASSPHSAIAFTLSGYVSNARDFISERYTLASSCVYSSREARRLCRRLVPEPAETDSAWRFCLIIAVMRLSILAMPTCRGRYAYGRISGCTAQRRGTTQTPLHACGS